MGQNPMIVAPARLAAIRQPEGQESTCLVGKWLILSY
jgi:hypothetical protein